MPGVRLVFFVAVVASFTFAQTSPCATKCNLQASECMKTCTGDPKDAQRPEKAQKLMGCLKTCEEQNRQCKTACSP